MEGRSTGAARGHGGAGSTPRSAFSAAVTENVPLGASQSSPALLSLGRITTSLTPAYPSVNRRRPIDWESASAGCKMPGCCMPA
jgi:hypothetical protein